MISRRSFISAGSAFIFCGLSGKAHAAGAVDLFWDVIVVGSGMSGLCAALSAKENGCSNVLMLEKGPLMGGHTLFSSGSIAAMIPQDSLRSLGTKDSVETFVSDAMRIGNQKGDICILKQLALHSADGLDWLEKKGIKFGAPFQAKAGLRQRSFSMTGNSPGRNYVMLLNSDRIKQKIPLLLRHQVKDVVPESDCWIVVVQTPEGLRNFKTRSLILAAGGSTANIARRVKHDSRLGAKLKTSANPWGRNYDGAHGEMLDIGEKAGWKVTEGNGYQIVPYWGGRVLDYAGGDIYVNSEGVRFVDENKPWHDISPIVLEWEKPEFFVITDSQSQKGSTLGVKLLSGIVKKSDSVREMAQGMGISPTQLQKTLDNYNSAVEHNFDPLFGKSLFTQKISKVPFYWGKETLTVHTSLDGIKTDDQARVLNMEGEPILGLYAAGETVGGVFGQDRLGGASLTNCLVMGRIAGQNAAQNANIMQRKNKG